MACQQMDLANVLIEADPLLKLLSDDPLQPLPIEIDVLGLQERDHRAKPFRGIRHLKQRLLGKIIKRQQIGNRKAKNKGIRWEYHLDLKILPCKKTFH